jgi:hypothetical protein
MNGRLEPTTGMHRGRKPGGTMSQHKKIERKKELDRRRRRRRKSVKLRAQEEKAATKLKK